MSHPLKLTPIVAAADPAHGVSRRAALQALWGSVATGLVAPSAVAGQHPIQQHLLSPGAIEQALRAAAAASGPAFLDAHQAKTLEVLAEAIVPGSTAAGVAPFLDQLLAVESEHTVEAADLSRMFVPFARLRGDVEPASPQEQQRRSCNEAAATAATTATAIACAG